VRFVAHHRIYSASGRPRQWRAAGCKTRDQTFMSEPTRPAHSGVIGRAFWRGFLWRLALGVGATFAVLAAWLYTIPDAQREAILGYWSRVQVTAPSFNLAPLLATPASVQLHVAAAVLALVVGVVIFLLPKGTGFHRALGWTWVSSMIVVAATSVAMIVDLKTGVNALHVFTAVTVVSLWAGLTGIRRGDVRQHAGSMIGLYVGGLIIAGAFAFIPGRTMWQVVFGG
jgi:uncharacterized membrane protein